MRHYYTTIRTAKFTVMLSSLAFATLGCTDSRTPYEAYVDCDRKIAEATSTRGVLSCYTDYDYGVLSHEAQDDDAWLSRFQSARPIVKRLHEEQLQDVADESILLIVGHTDSGRPTAISVRMHRDGGRWKIAKEETLAKGAAQDDMRPIRVSLKPVDGQDWYPGEMAGSIHRRRDGNCQLLVTHVFEYPMIRITTDCSRWATPGTYSLEELAPDGEQVTGSTPVIFDDEFKYRLPRVENGELTITESGNGVVSGEFTFDLANPRRQLSIIGSFQNIPFIPGG